MTQTAQHTETPFHLPLQVNGSEVTTSIWVEDAEGRRVLSVKAGERDADQCAYAAKAINAHDDLVESVKRLLCCMSLANWEGDPSAEFSRAALAKAGAA